MDSKILNFPEAMQLASILSKYVDTVSMSEMTGEDFMLKVFSSLSTDDIINITTLLDIQDMEKYEPTALMLLCTNMMLENSITSLVTTYIELGFTNG